MTKHEFNMTPSEDAQLLDLDALALIDAALSGKPFEAPRRVAAQPAVAVDAAAQCPHLRAMAAA